jgi:hypothetical protein
MRLFLRYCALLAGLLAITWLKSGPWLGMEFPRDPAPIFDSQVRQTHLNALESYRPEVAFLGDSTLGYGVDTSLFSSLTGRNALALRIDGSASAMWYLVLKNNITAAQAKPRHLILIVRDTILTAPGYRVQGVYFTKLDEFAYRHEAVVLERAFVNLMNPLEYAAEKYIPLYGARVQIRRTFDGAIRYSTPWFAGCDRACTDDAMFRTFDAADLEPGLYTPDQLDFAAQVDRSFLPEIIRLCNENGIHLVVVRLKAYSRMSGDIDSASVRAYISDLGDYLAANDVPFLDFGTEPRLERALYGDALHLNEEGREIFTRLLAEALEPVLQKLQRDPPPADPPATAH